MEQRFEELNQNVVFCFEVLRYTEELFGKKLTDITSLDSDYLSIKKMLSLNIQTLFNLDHFANRRVKLDIFSYLLKGFFDFQTIVPAFKISQHLLIDLMVDAQFEDLQDILSCLNKQRMDKFNKNLLTFLNEKANSGQFDLKLINFSIDWLLSEFNFQIYELIHSNLNFRIDLFYLTKILDKIIDSFECVHKKDLQYFLKSEPFKRFLSVLDLITYNFTNLPDKTKINNLKKVLNFLSFVMHQMSIEPQKPVNEFLNYFVKIIKKDYGLEFDEFFAIRHKLYGYEKYLNDFIQNLSLDKAKNLTQSDLEILKLASNELGDVNSVYLLIKILDRQQQSKLSIDLGQLFWSLFYMLNFDQKLDLIFMIYQLREVKIKKDAVLCLQDEHFDKEFTVSLNQVSATSDQDEQFLNKFSKLMCISVKSVADKIIFNILSNKTQVSALTKLLFRFNKLLKIDSSKDVNFSILINCLKSNLALILESRNEKMFQNLTCFLKLCLKSDSGILDPNEFYSKIIYDYFKLDSIDVESFIFILDIHDILIKYISLDLAQITFIIELYSNLSLKSIEKKNSSDALLKLTEKCLILIKNMVKLTDRMKFVDKEMENFKILVTKHHWTISLIVYPITEQIFIPKCLSPCISSLQAKIVHLEIVDTSLVECLLEMVSIQSIPINFGSISDEIESEEILLALVKILSLNKTSCEIKNLFNFLYEGFKKNIFKLQDKSFYSQWLKLIVCSIIILTDEGYNSEFILLNLIQFLKGLLIKERDFNKKIQNEIYIETLLNLLKLSFFQDDSISKEILSFLIELSNNVLILQDGNFLKNAELVVQECLILIEKIDENKFKNFKYLLKQNVEKLK